MQKYFGKIPVKTHEDFGISNQLKECIAFAVIGLCAYLKKPNTLHICTGADHDVVMGKISY